MNKHFVANDVVNRPLLYEMILILVACFMDSNCFFNKSDMLLTIWRIRKTEFLIHRSDFMDVLIVINSILGINKHDS